ncbi:lipopolysaccharide biosynthesis protein [Microbacterium sp. A1-JK]|uniref:lipopolysaccharide biosynthesis protein n=1 Tax=Microbacterium sp. A1-JK TaxID=3177516 RepID=UPI00388AFBB9
MGGIDVTSASRKNLLSYYANFAVVALAGLVVNPLLLSALGSQNFGVWKAIQRYLDLASVADGRSTQALKWVVANRNHLSSDEKRRDIGAALVVWLLWLPVLLVIAAAVTFFLPALINGLSSEQVPIATAAGGVLMASLVLGGLLSIPDSVLVGVNLGYRSMLLTTVIYVISNVAMILAALNGGGIVELAIIVSAGAILNGAGTWFIARQSVAWWGVKRPTRRDIGRVTGFSAWTLGGAAVEKALLSTELVLISFMIGASAVTQYTFTSYVLQFVLVIALITASGFMPQLGAFIGAGDGERASALAKQVRTWVLVVSAVMLAGVLALNGTFVSIWVGEAQYQGDAVNLVLVVLGLQLALIRLDTQVLDAALRMRARVLIGVLVVVVGFTVAVVVFQMTGSLIWSLLSVFVVRLVASVAYPRLVAGVIPKASIPKRTWIFAVLLLCASWGFGVAIGRAEGWSTVALGLTWFLVASATTWFGMFEASSRHQLVAWASSRFGRKR